MKRTEAVFVAFVDEVEPRLRRALIARRGQEDGRDATAEALAWAWEHWDEVAEMTNAAGYLYPVGQSRSRQRLVGPLHRSEQASRPAPLPIDEELAAALSRLPEGQRTAVLLVHGCDWSYSETAEAMGVSKSSVGTHLQRGLARLRTELEERQ